MVRQNQTLLNRSIAALRSKRLRHLGIGAGLARFENRQNRLCLKAADDSPRRR